MINEGKKICDFQKKVPKNQEWFWAHIDKEDELRADFCFKRKLVIELIRIIQMKFL